MLKSIIEAALLVIAGLAAISCVAIIKATNETVDEIFEILHLISKKIRKVFHRETKTMKDLKHSIRAEINKLAKIEGRQFALFIASSAINSRFAREIVGRPVRYMTNIDHIYNLGSYNFIDDIVTINSHYVYKAFYQKASISDLDILLDDIAHELRHAWQYDTGNYQKEPYISGDFDYEAYRAQPCEVDARRYAWFKVFFMSNKTKESILREVLDYISYYNNL